MTRHRRAAGAPHSERMLTIALVCFALAAICITCSFTGCEAVATAPSPVDAWYAVRRVVDGDTIVMTGIGTVRLIGVDTPETVDPRRPVQCFGREASAYLRARLDGVDVRLEYDTARHDRYRRTLAYVYLRDGTFVNAAIVRDGYGVAYTRFPFRHLESFRRLEREARESGRGLWGACR